MIINNPISAFIANDSRTNDDTNTKLRDPIRTGDFGIQKDNAEDVASHRKKPKDKTEDTTTENQNNGPETSDGAAKISERLQSSETDIGQRVDSNQMPKHESKNSHLPLAQANTAKQQPKGSDAKSGPQAVKNKQITNETGKGVKLSNILLLETHSHNSLKLMYLT
ncbi:hypothetical protein DPMN_054223 [Dreissena polymorpha]|uniref:Uncharacterized protein n=1 Tax=Dreissena polymorpha TaxID=45954 RepID=A0A9D4CMT3_DREPO|nr:hypothetical protein DPMN_054223 [Dreissena polymorpha]